MQEDDPSIIADLAADCKPLLLAQCATWHMPSLPILSGPSVARQIRKATSVVGFVLRLQSSDVSARRQEKFTKSARADRSDSARPVRSASLVHAARSGRHSHKNDGASAAWLMFCL